MSSLKATNRSQFTVRLPQRQRGRERVAALLTAAEQVIEARGFEAATMTEIAAQAGASIGSLYQFFPTKEALAQTLMASFVEELSQTFEAVGETLKGEPAALIADRILVEVSRFAATHPVSMQLMEVRREACVDQNSMLKMKAGMRQQLRRLLAIASPPLEPAREEIIASVMMHFIRSIALVEKEEVHLRAPMREEFRSMLRVSMESPRTSPPAKKASGKTVRRTRR